MSASLISYIAADATGYMMTFAPTPCTTANQTLACEDFRSDLIGGDVCCASITVRNGSSQVLQANLCYSRHLAYYMPTNTVGTITTTY